MTLAEHALYDAIRDAIIGLVLAPPGKSRKYDQCNDLLRQISHYLHLPRVPIEPRYAPAHLLAIRYQIYDARPCGDCAQRVNRNSGVREG